MTYPIAPLQPIYRKSLKDWLKGLTSEERGALRACDIDMSYLYMLSSGKRHASSDYAAKLEAASLVIFAERAEAGYVLRADISPACAVCPFFTRCDSSEKQNSRIAD